MKPRTSLARSKGPPAVERRFQAYGVGLNRTGTSSVAGIFDAYRSEQEFMHEETARAIKHRSEGRITRERLRRFLLRRDRAGMLEMDSSYTNGQCIDILAEEFPSAKFIFTIRNFYSWLGSEQNKLLIRAQNPALWPKESGAKQAAQEKVAAGYRFYQSEAAFLEYFPAILDRALDEWTRVNQWTLEHLPPERSLIVRTQDLAQNLDRMAALVGVDVSTLNAANAHKVRAPHNLNILAKVDRESLERKVMERGASLMTRFFPGYTLKDYLEGR